MKVLVIDDLAENIESAKQTLVGHELTTASTVQEAFDILWAWRQGKNGGFDVVLTDASMPLGQFEGYREGNFPYQADGTEEEFEAWIKSRDGRMDLQVGSFFALAASNLGALVGICSDRNHHMDWSAALLDLIVFEWKSDNRIASFYTPSPKNWGEALQKLLGDEAAGDSNYCDPVDLT